MCYIFNARVQTLYSRLVALISQPFERITYTEVIDILLKPENVRGARACAELGLFPLLHSFLTATSCLPCVWFGLQLAAGKFERHPVWGMDLGSEHERFIAEKIFNKPVRWVLTGNPFSNRPLAWAQPCPPPPNSPPSSPPPTSPLVATTVWLMVCSTACPLPFC